MHDQHLLGELINARTGARMAHVPYKGFALIVNAVLGNEIQFGLQYARRGVLQDR